MGLKENIKNRRLELNLTLEDVSKRLSISKPTLQRYESGVISNIPSDKIEKTCSNIRNNSIYFNGMGWKQNKNTFTTIRRIRIFIKKYNSLDNLGKHTVNTVLEMEFNRCSQLNNQDKSF